MTTENPELRRLIDGLKLFDSWEDRYRTIIDLGKKLPPFPAEAQTDENRVRGCVSQVWLVSEPTDDGHLGLQADSDSFIIKGLLSMLLLMYADRTPAEILEIDSRATFAEVGLDRHLSPLRSNGLASIDKEIRRRAAEMQAP